MNRYLVEIDVCNDDIDELDHPYSADLIFTLDGFAFARYTHDFNEFSKHEIVEFINAMKSNISNFKISNGGGNGDTSVSLKNGYCNFGVAHFGFSSNLTLPVNQSLVDAYDVICSYYSSQDVEFEE